MDLIWLNWIDLGIEKSRVPSGYQAHVFAPPRLKNIILPFFCFRCQSLKRKNPDLYQGLEKGKRASILLYVRAVTRTPITRDSADQDIA